MPGASNLIFWTPFSPFSYFNLKHRKSRRGIYLVCSPIDLNPERLLTKGPGGSLVVLLGRSENAFRIVSDVVGNYCRRSTTEFYASRFVVENNKTEHIFWRNARRSYCWKSHESRS